MISFVIAAETTTTDPLYVSILKIVIPIVMGGILTLVTWYLNRKAKSKDSKTKIVSETYKTDAEQASKQREFLIAENQNLYTILKEELEICRKERIESDNTMNSLHETIDELKKRLSKVEIELQAWEMGLKTPQGFVLNKIEEADE
jgi:hypothetical protein